MIKVGQIYKNRDGKIFLIAWESVYPYNIRSYCILYNNGEVDNITKNKIIDDSKLIAEYPTWQEAVNSEEFKIGGK